MSEIKKIVAENERKTWDALKDLETTKAWATTKGRITYKEALLMNRTRWNVWNEIKGLI
jgi:hypothetical protein